MLQHPVRKRRQAGAHLGNARWVNFTDNNAFPLVAPNQDLTPGVDQHAVTMRLPPIFVTTPLGDGQHVALVFDGAGT